jgi:hypothetical protein
MGRPQLPALQLDSVNGAARLAVWCPWCEELHHHGAGFGRRVSSCRGNSGSPFAVSGFEPTIYGVGRSAADARPPAVFTDGQPLSRKVRKAALAMQTALGVALLGKKGRISDLREISAGVIAGVAGGYWRVQAAPAGRVLGDGRELLSLGALLHGVPAGVVAVRVLEAATCATLDARAALEVQAAIDAWAARGAPSGEGRQV